MTKPDPVAFIEAAAECLDKPNELRDTIDDPPMYFDRQGKPMSLKAWVDAWADTRIIAEELIDGTRVVSAWTGTDHSFGDSPEPMIYGSAMFRDGQLVVEIDAPSEIEALTNHNQLCARARLEASQRS